MPAVFLVTTVVPPLSSPKFLSVPVCNVSAPEPEPITLLLEPMLNPPMSSVPPFRVSVVFSVPTPPARVRLLPSVKVPPVMLIVLVAAAFELDALAMTMPPVAVTAAVPLMFNATTDVFKVPVAEELLTFIKIALVTVVVLPEMFAVTCSGPPTCVVAPGVIESLPMLKVVMPTVPLPPMFRVATTAPLDVAVVAELMPRLRVPMVAVPVVAAVCIRFRVPVTVPEVSVVPERAATVTVVASSVPVSKENEPVPFCVVAALRPPIASVLSSRSAL